VDYDKIRQCLADCRFTDHARQEMAGRRPSTSRRMRPGDSRAKTRYHHGVPAGPRPVGRGVPAEENPMKCVICKTGEVGPARVRAEIKVGCDRLLVSIEAEACQQCGEAYYSAESLRYLERVRVDFSRKAITPASVGTVYQIS